MLTTKCVIIGDQEVGKTSLLVSYVTHTLPGDGKSAKIIDSFSRIIHLDDKKILICMWDTSSKEETKRLRSCTYRDTDVFIICISVVSPSSLKNARLLWKSEITEYSTTTPKIFVGIKSDESNQHTEEFRKRGLEPIPQSEIDDTMYSIGEKVTYRVLSLKKTAMMIKYLKNKLEFAPSRIVVDACI